MASEWPLIYKDFFFTTHLHTQLATPTQEREKKKDKGEEAASECEDEKSQQVAQTYIYKWVVKNLYI